MKNNQILSLIILTVVPFFVQAQLFLPEKAISKFDEGKMLIRWEPNSLAEWKSSQQSGYSISIRDISSNVVQDLPSKALVKPLPVDQWDAVMGSKSEFLRQFYKGSMNFLYPEMITDDSEQLASAMPGESQSSLDTFQMGLMLYSATYDFDLAKHTGLAFEFPARQGHKYQVEISTPGYPTITLDCDAIFETRDVPKLDATWSDMIVETEWNTLPYTKDFFGYMLERSIDGVNFRNQNDLPNVNTIEKYAKGDISLYSRKDSLEANYVTYYIRLRGFDYFGEMSRKFSQVIGSGFDKLTLSPSIIFADQTEDNEAHLKWQVPPAESHLIKDFTIWRADSIRGEFTIDTDSVHQSLREIKIPIKYNVNHYRIEANPRDGKSLSSMPVLVMGQDTVPPAMPILISATIDSLGRAEVVWNENEETDLWGYRVYKSNFAEDEFSLLNSYPTLDTVFIDSVDIDLGTKNIYYIVQAADKRNNRSPFSDTIELQLPDVIPPASPMVSKVEQVKDTVRVHFVGSMSEDVVEHVIYRRDIKDEESWQKIESVVAMEGVTTYDDMSAETGHHYAYTMIAIDDSGLESNPEFYKQIFVEKVEEEFIPFEEITWEVDEVTGKVKIKWECNDESRLRSILVYRGPSKDRLGKYKRLEAPVTEFEDQLKDGLPFTYYRLKPSYYEQKKHMMSKMLTIENPNFEEKGK